MEKLSKTKVGYFASLSRKKIRERERLFLVEGEKSVEDTLGRFKLKALVGRSEWLDHNRSLWLDCESDVYEATSEQMGKMSALSTPPVVAAVYEIPEEKPLKINDDHLILMLDGVQDPGNLGTIIRTAHWFGVHGIIASVDTVDLYNPKTLMATMGSLGCVDVWYRNLEEVLDEYPDKPVYGTVLDGKNIYKANLGTVGFIIMGNEGKGISLPLQQRLTQRLFIPPGNPSNHGESLNVGIATAVTLSQFAARKESGI